MKPKFALDLSHEGINLLHRRKGGWSLVGSVELDDPEMGAHLADLRRRAAALESGGLTCKIIIPNSQVLYTTLEAPGPDDIAREVQIRSGLDGLTPYPVGELVFDWRAAGEQARVAVLARETMDEAETFAVEHRFNPVSFVARPPAGEFSGEPFFGKTRAATKILGPAERVEPDASPVPRKPSTMDPYTPPASRAAPVAPSGMPEPEPAPHAPGELAWHPPADPAATPAPPPLAAPEARPVEDSWADVPAPPNRPDPDDPFAELDAIQAELSGDLSASPSFRSRPNRPQTRPPRSTSTADQPVAPPLAPFPPTSDDADRLPAPSSPANAQAPGKAKPQQKPAGADRGSATGVGPSNKAAPASADERAAHGAPASTDVGSQPESTPDANDDTPAAPGVAFSTRRNGDRSTTTATPTSRSVSPDTSNDPGAATPPRPTSAPAEQPAARLARKEASAADRRRAEMADALSRPLPGGSGTAGKTAKPPEKPTGRSSLSEAVRGAAGGLRSFGQRRPAGPGDDGKDHQRKPPDSSMSTLMRGAGAREARISPEQYADEPDLLAPDVAAKEVADRAPSAPKDTPAPAQQPGAGAPPASDAPAKPIAAAPPSAREPSTPTPASSTPASAAPAEQVSDPARAPRPAPLPTAEAPSAKPTAPAPLPSATPAKPKAPTSEAEALTVFGARRTEEKRGGRKYLGILLTLLLLLAMAIIGMWSSFFVDDADPALFNPDGDATAPEVPDPAPGPDSAAPDATGAETGDPTTGDVEPTDLAPDAATATDTGLAPTPQVLSPEEAEALYADTQIWQRAPDTLGEPFSPALELGAVDGPDAPREAPAAPDADSVPAVPTAPVAGDERAVPLPPPPADTVFELGDNGLVAPSPDGTVSPTGVLIFEGAPEVVPPARPTPPAQPEATQDDAALEQAVEQAVEAAAALTGDVPAAELPDAGPAPQPEEAPTPEATDTTAPEEGAALTTDPAAPTETAVETVAADPASIEAAVDAVAASFVNATDLAVARSIKPTQRPDDIDQIVQAAMARAAEAPAAAPAAAVAPATTTPAIPTSASVANQATTPNAIDLREINLLGISGPSNARRALVRMENGRYVTVKVGDRLDGGRVTSITSDGLTYQKGARNYTLQLLPLG